MHGDDGQTGHHGQAFGSGSRQGEEPLDIRAGDYLLDNDSSRGGRRLLVQEVREELVLAMDLNTQRLQNVRISKIFPHGSGRAYGFTLQPS